MPRSTRYLLELDTHRVKVACFSYTKLNRSIGAGPADPAARTGIRSWRGGMVYGVGGGRVWLSAAVDTLKAGRPSWATRLRSEGPFESQCPTYCSIRVDLYRKLAMPRRTRGGAAGDVRHGIWVRLSRRLCMPVRTDRRWAGCGAGRRAFGCVRKYTETCRVHVK